MERLAHFLQLDDTRQMFHIMRHIPDDWNCIEGTLKDREPRASTGLIRENVLNINQLGFTLSSDTCTPDLLGLFAGNRRIETVVFDRRGLDGFRECRSLATGLVERGYCGIVSFANIALDQTLIVQVKFLIPAPTVAVHPTFEIYWKPRVRPDELMQRISQVCQQLDPRPLPG
jgi:hypothetical protein